LYIIQDEQERRAHLLTRLINKILGNKEKSISSNKKINKFGFLFPFSLIQ
jgi:hypothetical protein